MIKAEVITHEGNNHPTWFERCRSAVTPSSLSAVVCIIAVAALVIAITRPDSVQQGSVSTPAAVSEGNALKVAPLQSESINEASSITPVQPVTNSSPSNTPAQGQSNGSSNLGPAPTAAPTSMNITNTPVNSITGNPSYEQSQLNGGGGKIRNNVHSTVNDVRALVNKLGL